MTKCKNCNCELIKAEDGWYHWIDKFKIADKCNCGCLKPEVNSDKS